MLTHRLALVIFLTGLAVLLISDRYFDLPFILYLLLIFFFIIAEIYGAAVINSGFHLSAVCSGSKENNEISLTFDDGPHDNTIKILDILKSENISATFFLIGKNVPGREHIVKRIIEEGHTVGNHSFDHNYWYDLKNKTAFVTDLTHAEKVILEASKRKVRYFRPPYGVTTPSLSKAVKTLNYIVIGWNIRSLDTKKQPSEVILKRIVKQLVPGSIVLLHDPVDGTDLVLQRLLAEVKKLRYNIVPLPVLINQPAYV